MQVVLSLAAEMTEIAVSAVLHPWKVKGAEIHSFHPVSQTGKDSLQ